MPVANTAARFTVASVIGAATISTANTNRDGTGTIGTVVTADSNGQGTRISAIRMVATGTTTAGVVRLFLHDGSNYYLIHEQLVTAETPSTTEQVFYANWFPPAEDFVLPPGWSIRASTHNAEEFNVIAIGGDY